MNREEVMEMYGEMIASDNCLEAYIAEHGDCVIGSFYYRYDADPLPVREAGQISFNRVDALGAEPVKVTTKEFHQAQFGDKLK